MKQDLIYFAQDGKGLTSTSANHLADMAKHYQEPLREQLQSINFVEESIEVIGGNPTITRKAWTSEQLNEVKGTLFNIAKADILDAYLREAVKAKESLLNEARRYDIEDWAEKQGIKLPEMPERESYLTEDDYLGSLNIKEREEFLQTKQFAAILGQFVHPRGAYNNARSRAFAKRNVPSEVNEKGRDTIITRWTVPMSNEELNNTFYELQETQREYQARYNGLKHKMELAIIADQAEKDEKFNVAMKEYNLTMKALNSQFETWRKAEITRISDLKIIIPNDLKDIYDVINSLGKQSK